MRPLSQPISKYFVSFRKYGVLTPPQRLLVHEGRAFATAVEPSLATAAKETEEVRKMDSLLGVVRERSNPAYRSITPLRNPSLWAETLLRMSAPSAHVQSPVSVYSGTTNALPTRKMHDSYSQITLPFASSPELLEQYTNAGGSIRIGKLMEHLDSLAGSIAYKHMLGPTVETLGPVSDRGFYIVTASVDRLDMLGNINPIRDIRISGHVIHTGSSSMEIAVKMEALEKDGKETTLMLGRFSMVCRDGRTLKAHPVCKLTIENDDERNLFEMGKEFKDRRIMREKLSLSRVPPSSEEAATLHSFMLQYGQEKLHSELSNSCIERVWTGDARLEKCQLMFPQSRNVHSKIFGGYLMRLAYELGFANATLFNRELQRFMSLDGISFARPVEIGSILRLTSQVMHTLVESDMRVTHLGVRADVVDVQTGEEQITDDFRFTFSSLAPNSKATAETGAEKKARRLVVPRTYTEAMLWLEGKRALQIGATIRGLRAA